MTLEKILDKVFRKREVFHNGELYLKRYYLLPRSWPIKLFLHVIYKPDDDRWPHDHPWSWVGLILKGAYSEALYSLGGQFEKYVVRTPGSIAYRSKKDVHQIEALLSDKVWTLVCTGPATQIWGFVKNGMKTDWHVYQNKPYRPPTEDKPI